MKTNGLRRRMGLLACGLALACAAESFAQGDILRMRRITDDKVQTPEYNVRVGGSSGSGRRRLWYVITTEYDSAPDWIDEMRFRYYVLVRDKQNTQRLFSDEITYVNVAKGRHESVIYLHPSTVDRFGDVQAIAVQVYVEGRLAGLINKPETNVRWWEQFSPTPGYLLNRLQTPFAMINFDNYEAIKSTTPR
ncbi:MAG: hypothetical protein K9N49_08125 [Candidatus Marinimicrobia bacterium]|nr:hypothetical protein [Candidatus Neomarinimicrobiota bacterium]